jgi:hypothetical protein
MSIFTEYVNMSIYISPPARTFHFRHGSGPSPLSGLTLFPGWDDLHILEAIEYVCFILDLVISRWKRPSPSN